jgi:16S rRNA (adenine1518-N6/adenine1519-N6)-dimethyltransferase
MARQRLGQHFLSDAHWRGRILARLGVSRDDLWIEIGAGRGEMTRELARASRRVVAIELDAQLIPALRRLAAETPNLEVVHGDILALDLAALVPSGEFRVYGSLPYYITSPILHRLFAYSSRMRSAHVVIQWEVAERVATGPGSRDYGYLSVATQFYARPAIEFRIPPGAFQPPPKVASALVSLQMPGAGAALGLGDAAAFLEFVQACFAQKRKTLLNNLLAMGSRAEAEAWMASVGVRRDARAEQLPLEQFAALYRAVRAA